MEKFLESALFQTRVTLFYDPSYVKLAYPGGDVPIERGVCTDVIIRSLRVAGIDLQKLVHEDMTSHFRLYPRLWRLAKPDSNIDHRRVPNLETFFSRKGFRVATLAPDSFQAGDIIVWRLPNGRPHIGIIAAGQAGTHPLCIHNVGAGTCLEDVLAKWTITGHYRFPFSPP